MLTLGSRSSWIQLAVVLGALALLTQDASGAARDTRIRFLGTPAGYEFVSLVQALMLAGGHASSLTPENRARVEAVTTPTTIQVFSTPT